MIQSPSIFLDTLINFDTKNLDETTIAKIELFFEKYTREEYTKILVVCVHLFDWI